MSAGSRNGGREAKLRSGTPWSSGLVRSVLWRIERRGRKKKRGAGEEKEKRGGSAVREKLEQVGVGGSRWLQATHVVWVRGMATARGTGEEDDSAWLDGTRGAYQTVRAQLICKTGKQQEQNLFSRTQNFSDLDKIL